jgi:aspartate carbamoyltransferase regulatory subunit
MARRTVRLADEVGDGVIIEGKTYENCVIDGPAIILLISNIEMSDIDLGGEPDHVLIEMPENREVIGIIGLQNVAFRRCTFNRIGIMAPKETLDLIRNAQR